MKKFLVTSLVCFAMIGMTVPAYAHGHHGGGYGYGCGNGSGYCSVNNICSNFQMRMVSVIISMIMMEMASAITVMHGRQLRQQQFRPLMYAEDAITINSH